MYQITAALLEAYALFLRRTELASGTVENYLRHLRAFAAYAGEREVTRELTAAWRDKLCDLGRKPGTVNGMLVSLNVFFKFAGWNGVSCKLLRIQRRVFRDEDRELTREEYQRLLAVAAVMNPRLAMIMETICATGIRVSELRYITVEAVSRGQAEIRMKGKLRTIIIPGKLAKKLKKYAKAQKIGSGVLFVTRTGKPVPRRQIWAEMKAICEKA